MLTQPQQCWTMECPLAGKARGFVLPSGPIISGLAVILDTPDPNDLIADVSEEEYERRKRLYPDLSEQYLRRGYGGHGKSSELWQWAGVAAGLNQHATYVTHTLRCLPPFDGKSSYPTGNTRKRSESCCRHYDRWDVFQPTVSVNSLRPDSVMGEPTPLPLQIVSLRKARDFATAGEKVVVLAGGKSAQTWLGYASNEARFVGSYEIETDGVRERRERRREDGMRVSVVKKVKVAKVKKLTAKTALLSLLANAKRYTSNNELEGAELLYGSGITYVGSFGLSDVEYHEMLSLAQPVKRKVKVTVSE